MLMLASCSPNSFNDPIDNQTEVEFIMIRSSSTHQSYNGDEDQSYEIEVEVSNDTAYVSKDEVSYSSAHHKGSFVNLSGISMQGDTLLILDSDTYWFIPFSEDEALSTTNVPWEFKCGCGGHLQPPEGCEVKETMNVTYCDKPPEAECDNYCIGWQIKAPATPGAISYPYGGVMVKANVLVER
jgi:hypothetical protein